MDFQKLKNIVSTNSRKPQQLISYIEQVESFDITNPSLTTKDLTIITNSFDKILGNYYKRPEDDVIRELAKERGFVFSYGGGTGDLMKYSAAGYSPFAFPTIYGLSTAYQFIERINKLSLNDKEKDFLNTYRPNLQLFADFYSKLEEIRSELKPSMQKRREKQVQQIKGSINPELKNIIDKIGEDFKKVLYENFYNKFTRIVGEFKQKFPTGANEKDYMRFSTSHKIIYLFVEKTQGKENGYEVIFHLKPNVNEIIEKTALQRSGDEIKIFLFKMYDKLGGFLQELNKEVKVTYSGSNNENRIYFNFADGSKFEIRNKIVPHWRENTFYVQYPTTFHNAYLADGTKVNQPSELTVKQAFKK